MVLSLPLSAFTAVPNPQMMAFMGAQSFVMMEMAGIGWQYGKRRISAMSNKEFNELTPELLFEKQTQMLERLIPTVEKSMNDMTPMMRTIIQQYGEFVKLIIQEIPALVQNVTGFENVGDVVQDIGQGAIESVIDPWWWKLWKSLFPSLPEAEARRGSTKVQTNDLEGLKIVYTQLLKTDVKKKEIGRPVISPTVNVVPVELMQLHQKWAKVSTQTLNIERVRLTKEFTNKAKQLSMTPKTLKMKVYKFLKFGAKSKKVFSHFKIVPSPHYDKRKKEYDILQQKLSNITSYITWRKSK